MKQANTKLYFVTDLPRPKSFGSDTVLIFDRALARKVPGFAQWTSGFSARMAITAGEGLKDLRAFPAHCEKFLQVTQGLNSRQLTIVVAGGGSVGDFAGFLASVFKRGVRLVQIPTTWLAAIDSAHGGKTALNLRGGKNQIGTFYPAAEIYLIANVLKAQNVERQTDALGELAKIALLDGGRWVKKLERSASLHSAHNPGLLLERFLRDAIRAKYLVVKQDPQEKSGVRQILNLGHTLGHVLEASVGLSHGTAVAQGTFFAIDWSLHRGLLSASEHARCERLLREVCGLRRLVGDRSYMQKRPSAQVARRLLMLDKKQAARKRVTFVFLEGVGKARRCEVTIDEILREATRQRWIR